jgi:hypothetical protein
MGTGRCLATWAGLALACLLSTTAFTAERPKSNSEPDLLTPSPISSWGEFYLGDGTAIAAARLGDGAAMKAAGPTSEPAADGWDFKDRFPLLDRDQQPTMTPTR